MILFPRGGSIQIRSADNPDSLRGEGLDLIVYDESAFMREEAFTEAGRPALSDREGGALFISTPKGRNWFWRLYMRGLSDETGWAAWRLPTSSNPHIKPAEIEAARQHLPAAVFSQEYLAEFVEDAGLVFRNLAACIHPAPPATPEPGRRYYMGVDWGQSRDFTVLLVIDDRGVVVALDRFNQIGWDVQRGRLETLALHWQVELIMAEANSMGGPNIEALQARGLPVFAFTTTTDSKDRLIQALTLAFEQRNISIPDDPVLLAELQAFEAERLPSGRWRYEAPGGMHDDTVIALALAHEARQSGGRLSIMFLDA